MAAIYKAQNFRRPLSVMRGKGDHLPILWMGDSTAQWPNGGGSGDTGHAGHIVAWINALVNKGYTLAATSLIMHGNNNAGPTFAGYGNWHTDNQWNAEVIGGSGVNMEGSTAPAELLVHWNRRAQTNNSIIADMQGANHWNRIWPGDARYLGAAGPHPIIGRVFGPMPVAKAGHAIDPTYEYEGVYWYGNFGTTNVQITAAQPENVEVNDVFNLRIGTTVVASFTATAATVANVTAGLTEAWNDNTTDNQGIVATDAGTCVVLTGAASQVFTVNATTTNGGAANTQMIRLFNNVGQFVPAFLATSGSAGNVTGSAVSTRGTAGELSRAILEIPANAGRNASAYRLAWGTNSADVLHPVMAYGSQLRRVNYGGGGFAVHMLEAVGGATSETMALALQNLSDEGLEWFFRAATDHQTVKEAVLLMHPGINDSLYLTHTQVRGFIIDAIDRAREVWSDLGYDADKLHVGLQAPHPIGSNSGAYSSDRQQFVIDVADDMVYVADQRPRVCVIRTPDLITADFLTANDYYEGGGDGSTHLAYRHNAEPDGYLAVDTILLEELEQQAAAPATSRIGVGIGANGPTTGPLTAPLTLPLTST